MTTGRTFGQVADLDKPEVFAEPVPKRAKRRLISRSTVLATSEARDLFWSQVQKDPSAPTIANAPWLGPCWLWTGQTNAEGYGQFRFTRSSTWYAHRFAYSLQYGALTWPYLDHLCHSYSYSCRGGVRCLHRLCVSPLHLEAVSAAENSRRVTRWNAAKDRRERVVWPVCRNGHRWSLNIALYDWQGKRVCGDCHEGMY